MAEKTEYALLVERSTARNAQIWADLTGGYYIPDLLSYEAIINDVHYYDIFQYIDMGTEDYKLQAGIRDDMHDLALLEISTEREIAKLSYDNKIQILSLDKAGKNLLLKAEEHDALVKDLIMIAKTYLSAIENKERWLEKDRAEMAVDKEEANLKEIQAKIILEQYERKSVEVQIARAEVDAAKAAVQAIMAEIAKGEAEIKIIQAEVEYSMAEAEKATLNADIATILAEIITKGLAKIRLEVDRAEIAKGYEWLATYLADMLREWDKKLLAIDFQADSEETIGRTIDALTAAQKELEYLSIDKVVSDQTVWDAEEAKLESLKTLEEIAREESFNAKQEYEAEKSSQEVRKSSKSIWASALVQLARRWTYLNGHHIIHNTKYQTDIIHQGIAGTPGFAITSIGDACS